MEDKYIKAIEDEYKHIIRNSSLYRSYEESLKVKHFKMALEIIEKYKRRQNRALQKEEKKMQEGQQPQEFRVGDEVRFKGKKTRFVITSINKDKHHNPGFLNGIGPDGVAFCDKDFTHWEKTGRYFPEVAEFMKKFSTEE